MTDLFSKIKEVTEIPAISGHEAPVRDYLRQQLTPHVDEIVTDGLGGIFGVKHSTAADAPRILVAAHLPLATSSLMQALALKPKLKAMESVLEIPWSQIALRFLLLMVKTSSLKHGITATAS